MAITLVQSASNYSSSGTVAATYPSNVTAGNLLVACVMSDTDGDTVSSKTDTLGQTYSTATSPTTVTGKGTIVGIFYVANTTSGANVVTVSCAGSGLSLIILEYSGIATSTPLDVTGRTSGAGSATPTVSGTTTVSGDLVIGAILNNRSALTAGSGYTVQQDVVFNNWFDVEDKVAGAAGSYAADGTISSAGEWGVHLAAFKSGGGAPPVATKLLYGTQPTSSVSGQAVPSFTVRVTDSGGTTVTSATNTVTVAATLGTLTGTLSTAAVSGIATFSGVIDTGVNTGETLAATATGLTGATSSAFNVTTPATSGTVDLSQLPVANRQVPLWSAYQALNVNAIAALGSYNDPTTARKVWKLTSATNPVANASAMHAYSSGGLQISRPWGTGSDKYTLYVMTDGSEGWLRDFQLGVGFTNLRATPWSSDLRFSFSMVAATPQKAYYVDSSSRLWSYNTSTGASTLLKSFAAQIGGQQLQYLQLDKTDRYFVFMDAPGVTVYWWDSVTDTLKNVNETRINAVRGPGQQLDEPHLEKNGRYIEIKNAFYVNVGGGDYRNSMLWDTTNDKLSDLIDGWSHSEGVTGLFFGTNPNDGNEEIFSPSPVTVEGQASAGTRTVIATDSQFGAAESHRAGQWDQTPTGTNQYEFVSVDGPTGGRGGLSWSNVGGSKWATPVFYQYQQAAVGVRDVLELNSAGTAISARLTQVADVASITGAGKWCLVGSTVTVWRTDSGQPDTTGKTMYLEVTCLLHEALGFVKGDFTDVRLAGHHYSNNPNLTDYYASPRGTVSRDGKLIMFTSNMGVYGQRKDAFLMEMPVVASSPTQLVVLTEPSLTNTSGVAHPVQPVVKIADSGGNTVTSDTSTVTASLVVEQGTGTTIGTLTKAAVAGIADFAGNGLGVTSSVGRFHWHYTDGALTSTNSASFTVGTPPTASFAVTGVLLTRTFDSTASTGTSLTRAWTFGDGGTSTSIIPTHTYATAGTYTVTLTVTDAASFTNSTSQSVTVTAPAPTTLQLVTAPSTTGFTATALAVQPAVAMLDQTGALYTTPVAITLSSTGLTNGGVPTVITVAGVATWPDVGFSPAGTTTLTATATHGIASLTVGTVVVSDPPPGTTPPPAPIPTPTPTPTRQYVRRRHHRKP